MDLLPNGLSVALYAVTAVCGIGLLIMWISSARARRNAGFTSKGQLKRQLSAKAALRATEIRPSFTDDGKPGSPATPVELSKG
ncbi:hypothetical protein [Streptomyces sp. x-80]|uniref:hypothetical protein n=1 Tax=Streptomyces sp. x-80 TaxID=2789282 RepID=UPI0039807CF5